MDWRFGGLRASHLLPAANITRASFSPSSVSATTKPVLRPAPRTASSETQAQGSARQQGGRRSRQQIALQRSNSGPASQNSRPSYPEAEAQPANGALSPWQQHAPSHAQSAGRQGDGRSDAPSVDQQRHTKDGKGSSDQLPSANKRRAPAVQTSNAPRINSSSAKNRKQKQQRGSAAQTDDDGEAQGSHRTLPKRTGTHQQQTQTQHRTRLPTSLASRHQKSTSTVKQATRDPSDGQTQAASPAVARPRASHGVAEDAPHKVRAKRPTALELLLMSGRDGLAADTFGPAAEFGGESGMLKAAAILTSLGMGQLEAAALLEDAAAAADGLPVSAVRVQHVCDWLTSAGVTVGQLAAVLRAHPDALAAQPHRDWLPKVEFLVQLGLTIPQIERMTRRHPPWLVGTRLQELPETAAAVHKAGIPRKRVPAVLYKHPSILSRPPGDVLDTGRVLRELLGSPGNAAQAVPRHPKLLSVDLRLQHAVFLQTLDLYRLSASNAAQIIAGAPELLAEDVRTFQPVLSVLQEHGFQACDMVEMLSEAPHLLLQDAASLRTRLVFLLQHRGKTSRDVIQDVVRYPRYFEHSLTSCVGPRLAFLQARGMEDKAAELSLAYLFSRSDTDFAEQVLIEDYLVWKAQWERTDGVEYGWRPSNVRSVVQPSRAVGAEGRFAVV